MPVGKISASYSRRQYGISMLSICNQKIKKKVTSKTLVINLTIMRVEKKKKIKTLQDIKFGSKDQKCIENSVKHLQ